MLLDAVVRRRRPSSKGSRGFKANLVGGSCDSYCYITLPIDLVVPECTTLVIPSYTLSLSLQPAASGCSAKESSPYGSPY